MTSDVDNEDLAHNSLVEEIRKINSVDRKKSKRSQLKNVRVTRKSELPSDKLSNILSKIGGGGTNKKKKLAPLIEPLEKPKAKRLQREAGFERVAVEANKWACVVEEMKKADQLHFPLEKVDLRVITSEKNYKPLMQTELEKEIYGLLSGAGLDVEEKPETEEEKNIKKAMSLKEIRARSQKIMKDRNLRIRLERKAALLNKSKSRKYHKILRRERLKRKKQEFETLKETKPEEALKVLDELEKTRIKERMDLRHKRSKWIHLQQSRAPHDNKVRDVLRENKELREELLEKVKLQEQSFVENDDDNDDGDSDEKEKLMDVMKHQAQAIKDGKFDSQNLWVSHLAVPDSADSAPDESFYKMKKFWENRNEEKLKELEALKVVKEYEEKEKRTKCDEEEEEFEEYEAQVNDKDEIETESETEEDLRKVKKPSERKEKKSSKIKMAKKKKQIETEKKSKLKVSTNKKNKIQEIKKKKNKKENEETKHESEPRNTNCDTNKQISIIKIKDNHSNVQVKEIRSDNINNCNENKISKSTILKNLTLAAKKESKSEEKETCNQPKQNFSKIVDRRMGNTKHDYGFLKRMLNNEDSDSEKEDLADIFDSGDYVKEFEEEKKDHEESRKIKDIDKFKPGWGSWGGPGIEVSEAKRRRFRIKAPKVAPNKYSNIGNVIYREKADMNENLRKMMVKEVPFPFTSVKDFEAHIRQPILRTFVPEAMHKKLIAPPVVLKMGAIIEPMSEEYLIKNYEDQKRKETELEKELNKELKNLNVHKKRKTEKEINDNKRRKANKKKKKNRSKAKPVIFL